MFQYQSCQYIKHVDVYVLYEICNMIYRYIIVKKKNQQLMLNILYNMNIFLCNVEKKTFFLNITHRPVQQGRHKQALAKYCVVEIAIYYWVLHASCLSSKKSVDRMDLLTQT